VKPLAFQGAKTIGHETLKTVANILSHITTRLPETKVKDIVAHLLAESTQGLVFKLKGGGRKRKAAADTSITHSPEKKKAKAKVEKQKHQTPTKEKIFKRGIFS
jgi:N6-adenosine-specific RNA methylase IME4